LQNEKLKLKIEKSRALVGKFAFGTWQFSFFDETWRFSKR